MKKIKIGLIWQQKMENGNKATTKFVGDLGFNLHASTVRSFKRAYYEQLQSIKDSDAITKLEGKKCGQPTTLPKEMENSLKEYIH